jgi:hypothetical protein
MQTDQREAIEKAKRFAHNAYVAESQKVDLEHEMNRANARATLAARGLAVSSVMINEMARIDAERIRALAEARLSTTMEGYELHGIEIDDAMATSLCFDIMGEVNRMIKQAQLQGPQVPIQNAGSLYLPALGRQLRISVEWVRTQIDRRRLMPNKNEGPAVIYSVQGDNSRLNLNSTDNSANIVVKSDAELFAKLREHIKAIVTDEGERGKIFNAITALQEAQGKPSFAQRYTDLIAVAADHMTILTPFIPALSEMLSHVLKAS